MNYDDLQAGREMDALVAEIIFCYKFIKLPPTNQYGLCNHCGRALPDDPRNRQQERGTCYGDCNYSDEIAAAWKVVEKIIDMPAYFCLDFDMHEWIARIAPEGNRIIAHGSTAPLAICRAALNAMEAH